MTRTLVFLALASNIAAFFIFIYPKTYSKVSAESVIRISEPLLVSVGKWDFELMLLDGCTHISSAGFKNALSRRTVQERPISAPGPRTTYLKRDFCFSDFVAAALRDFKIRLLYSLNVKYWNFTISEVTYLSLLQ